MNTHRWLPVLFWGGLLFGGIAQGWAQCTCSTKPKACCVGIAQVSQPADCSGLAPGSGVNTCRQHACDSRQTKEGYVQKATIQRAGTACEPCKTAWSQKCQPQLAALPRGKAKAAAEPRKLSVPHGQARRLTVCGVFEAESLSRFGKCAPCQTDCRRETVFGTETILGDVCFDGFFATLQGKCSACRPRIGGRAESAIAKGTAGLPCRCEGGDLPILNGPPEEPAGEDNPFRDDAVEAIPLRPLPQASGATSAARQPAPAVSPPAPLRVVRAKPVATQSADAVCEVERMRLGDWLPDPLAIFD